MKTKTLMTICFLVTGLALMTSCCQKDNEEKWSGTSYSSEDYSDILATGFFQSEEECIKWGKSEIIRTQNLATRYTCRPDIPPDVT